MKKPTFLNAFKIGFALLPSRLFRFIKKLFAVLMLYGWISLIPMTISFLGMSLVENFTHNTNAADTVFKILATIGQIVPLSFSLYLSECELKATDEDSTELCFAIFAVVIAALWIK